MEIEIGARLAYTIITVVVVWGVYGVICAKIMTD